jgi:hypothetical protein
VVVFVAAVAAVAAVQRQAARVPANSAPSLLRMFMSFPLLATVAAAQKHQTIRS